MRLVFWFWRPMSGRRFTVRFTTHRYPRPSRRRYSRLYAGLPNSEGFTGSRHDGDPGVKTIWRGLRRLHDIAATWKLLRPNCLPIANAETYG